MTTALGRWILDEAYDHSNDRLSEVRSAIFRASGSVPQRQHDLICPDCGTREALTEIGVAADEQEQIIEIIHKCKGGGAR